MLQTKGELAEAVASLEAGKGGLAAQTDHAAQLQTQLELTQDKVAGARAGACAAENNLRTAEEKVNELTHNLDSDKISHSQAMKELRLQQAEEKQVHHKCLTACLLSCTLCCLSLLYTIAFSACMQHICIATAVS